MLRPETEEKMKLLWEFLRAAGFHGVRLTFAKSPLVTDMTLMVTKAQSLVTGGGGRLQGGLYGGDPLQGRRNGEILAALISFLQEAMDGLLMR